MNVWFPAYATNLSEKWIYMEIWQLNFKKKSPIGDQNDSNLWQPFYN